MAAAIGPAQSQSSRVVRPASNPGPRAHPCTVPPPSLKMANSNIDVKYTKLFINNEFVDSANGKTFPTINPATEKKIVDVAEAGKEDVDKAVAAARAAFNRKSEWRTMDASRRGEMMIKLASLMETNKNYLANLESLDNGKPFNDSIFDMDCSIKTIQYYAGWCDKIHGNTIPADGNVMSITRKEPVGVVSAIIPWNYPILMATWKMGPALATGCTMILKPAEQTPLSALFLAQLVKEAGFPPGVFNVVNGHGTTGAFLSSHMDVNKVAFTGSTEVGRLIMEAAARSNLKRVSLELGGKSPLVVFDDADVDEAVTIAHNGIFANHGQNCCAASRTFVHEKVYDEFVKKAAAKASARKVGDPFTAGTDQGPQVDKEMFEKVTGLIESGKKEGAKVVAGGDRVGKVGYFVQPTVFADVQDNMRIAREEIFGPVQQILKFSSMEEVIARANNTTYGLAAGIITTDINKALKFAESVLAGSVWVNCYDYVVPQAPFGGFKQSGFGRELGEESLKEYLETKTITIQLPSL